MSLRFLSRPKVHAMALRIAGLQQMKGRLSSFLAKRLGTVFHCALALAICSAGALADEPDFERDIAPIIAKRCLECHDADKATMQTRPVVV